MLKLITQVNEEVYWLKCTVCGTFVVGTADKADKFNANICPTCCEIDSEEYPFKFISKEQYENQSWVKDSLKWLQNMETM